MLDIIFFSSFLFNPHFSLFFDVMFIIFGAPSVAFSNSPPSSLALPSIYHLPFHCVLAHLPEDEGAPSCYLIQFKPISFDWRYLIHVAPPRRSFLWALLPLPAHNSRRSTITHHTSHIYIYTMPIFLTALFLRTTADSNSLCHLFGRKGLHPRSIIYVGESRTEKYISEVLTPYSTQCASGCISIKSNRQ